MIRPPYLQKGDKIAIVAPAGKVEREKVDLAVRIFEKWGYEVEVGDNVFNDYHTFSARDDQRVDDLQKAMNSENIRAIMCARGGYGCIRIVGKLDYSKFQGNPKWLIGFSDITVLHAKLNALGVESIHGIMPVKFPCDGSESDDLRILKKLIEGEIPEYKLESHSLNRIGKCGGEIVGGNLSVLYGMHNADIDKKKYERILFIEDVGENLYHLDRMMQTLKYSGKLERLQGLIVGQFTEMKDSNPYFGKSAYEIISEAVEDYEFPVVYGFPAGHGDVNIPVLLGAMAELDVGNSYYTLRYKE